LSEAAGARAEDVASAAADEDADAAANADADEDADFGSALASTEVPLAQATVFAMATAMTRANEILNHRQYGDTRATASPASILFVCRSIFS
jgi:hypothetical protein